MTALETYLCLEAIGFLRERPNDTPVEVVVSLGKATLLLKDTLDRPLGHWALAGVVRLGRDEDAVIYSMTAEGSETLTIRDKDMVEAIAALSRPALGQPEPAARRPRRRARIELPVMPILLAAAMGAAILGLPRLLQAKADQVVPPAAAAAVGDRILTELIEKRGPLCAARPGQEALARIVERLEPATPPRIHVLDLGGVPAVLIPGDVLLIDRNLVRTASAEEIAGWSMLAFTRDPVRLLLAGAGTLADLRFLLTGSFPQEALDRATHLLLTPADQAQAPRVAARLAAARIDPAPFLAAAHLAPEPPATPSPPPLLDPVYRKALRTVCG